jgi:F-type H+-transporting ATPase subunit delta
MTENGDIQFHPTADVGAQRVAKVYAEALLNVADERGQMESVLDELNGLVADVFAADPVVETFLASPAVRQEPKAEVLRAVFSERASDLFLDFLLVLNEHERLDLLRPIAQAYRDLYDEKVRRVRVRVRSAVVLPDDQRTRLEETLRETLRQEPILETRIDPEMLGGLIVKVGDWQYDASVRTTLKTLSDQIIARSSHEIQSGRDRFSSADGD